MLEEAPVRRSGDNIWRPSLWARAAYLLLGLAFLAGTVWLATDGGPLTPKDMVEFSTGDLLVLVGLPIVLFRWRMVLEPDELIFVFFRERRQCLREIVEAKCVARRGLVFVCKDGSDQSFAALGNTVRGHRRKNPTRTDLAARAVLCAAATARGEVPPVDYRLPPMSGLKRAAIEGGIAGFVIGLFLGD
jgi:hypothetical protein